MGVESLKPYWYVARWHRPVGSLLLMFPCWWGIAYYPWHEGSLYFLVLCAIGSFIMRGAGCTLNDWFDQDFDRRVERCKTRPIAAHQLNKDQVFGFIALQLSLGALVLWHFPYRVWPFAFLGAALTVFYPLTKRMTNYPQLILGLTFNMGVWIGAVAMAPSFMDDILPLSLLYGVGICWTLGYDTIYALQDKNDDLQIGIGSTTIAFGKYVKPIIGITYLVAFILLCSVGILSQRAPLFFVLLPVVFIAIEWRLYRLEITERAACDGFFKENIWLGLAIYLALALS